MKKKYLKNLNYDATQNYVIKKLSRVKHKNKHLIENKIIAVDFDGTIVSNKYPEIGAPNYELINKLRYLGRYNTLILWTCRNGKKLKEAVNFCENLGLKFNYINENSKEVLKLYRGVDSRKITADIYLDDKSRRKL